MKQETKLDILRNSIDEINIQLLDVLVMRANVVEEVGEFKRQHNMPALQPERYQKMLDGLLETAREKGLDELMVREIFDAIHRSALRHEAEIIDK